MTLTLSCTCCDYSVFIKKAQHLRPRHVDAGLYRENFIFLSAATQKTNMLLCSYTERIFVTFCK